MHRKIQSVYIGDEDRELYDRMLKLSEKCGVAVGRLFIASAAACIHTLEKELPKKRVFVLNGKEVRP